MVYEHGDLQFYNLETASCDFLYSEPSDDPKEQERRKILRELNGLVLSSKTGKIVARPFHKIPSFSSFSENIVSY
jgi:hypothetical protein